MKNFIRLFPQAIEKQSCFNPFWAVALSSECVKKVQIFPIRMAWFLLLLVSMRSYRDQQAYAQHVYLPYEDFTQYILYFFRLNCFLINRWWSLLNKEGNRHRLNIDSTTNNQYSHSIWRKTARTLKMWRNRIEAQVWTWRLYWFVHIWMDIYPIWQKEKNNNSTIMWQ